MKNIFVFIFILFIYCNSSFAQDKPAESISEISKKAQNPLNPMITVPIVDYCYFDYGPDKKIMNSIQVKPVFPFELGKKITLIVRAIVPLNIIPAPLNKAGLGDAQLQLFLSPSQSKVTWGVGPVIGFPTGTPEELGSGKWSAGPIGVILFSVKKSVFGLLATNRWSFAGDGSKGDVNQMMLNPFFNYNFPKGWAITTAPEIYANWGQSSSEMWTLPMGAGVIKTFRIGKNVMTANIQYYYHLIKPQYAGSSYLKAGISFLFPKQPKATTK
jgi:hypothetical protein